MPPGDTYGFHQYILKPINHCSLQTGVIDYFNEGFFCLFVCLFCAGGSCSTNQTSRQGKHRSEEEYRDESRHWNVTVGRRTSSGEAPPSFCHCTLTCFTPVSLSGMGEGAWRWTSFESHSSALCWKSHREHFPKTPDRFHIEFLRVKTSSHRVGPPKRQL